MLVPHHPEYIHHQNPNIGASIREFVFGIEDGMVSTLGAITGIAAGTQDHFTTILAGFVIVSVESISMAVGSYLSTKSEVAVNQRKLNEEKKELIDYPEEERTELIGLYVADGWSEGLATTMATEASKNDKLFLQEMAYRELKVFPEYMEKPLKNAVIMGFSYIGGGSIPLIPYLLLPFGNALPFSVGITLVGLFAVGAGTTKFSHRTWWKAGFEMLLLASAAALVGYGVGQLVTLF